jgi:transposase
MDRFYAGIDLAARSLWLCIVDTTGRKVFSRKLPNDPDRIARALEPYGTGLSAVVESTFNWYWLVDLLEDLRIETQLAHPLYLKAIAYAKVKTDRVDAHTLAQLLRLGYIPQAFIYPRELRPARDLVRRRNRLVNLRAGMYRDLKLQLMKRNITEFSRNAIKQIDGRHLRSLLPTSDERRIGVALVRLIGTLNQEVEALDKAIQQAVKGIPSVTLLRTIPGVGKTLAPTLYYEIGEIRRFQDAKAFSSYCRVAPTVSQSGAVVKKGKNRKQGNRYLKWALSEAAQMAIQRHPTIREMFVRILKKKKKRIVAKAILAHKLAVVVFRVLHDQVPYRPEMLLK